MVVVHSWCRRRSFTRYSRFVFLRLLLLLRLLPLAAAAACGSTTTPPVRHSTTLFPPQEETPTTLPDDAVLQEFFFSPHHPQPAHHHHGFHIHGWKWHTMSLIHQARRLSRLAASHDRRDVTKALRTMADYTIHFNLHGLHRIENEIFFPTLRQRVLSSSSSSSSSSSTNNKTNTTTTTTHLLPPLVAAAVTTVLNQLDQDRQRVAALGTLLMTQVSIATNAVESRERRTGALTQVAQQAAAIATLTQSMLDRELQVVLPIVARIWTESEQSLLNGRVIRALGLLDARLHLVGMSEAISEDDNAVEERQLFQRVIPGLAQSLLPRWKRTLYDPRAGDDWLWQKDDDDRSKRR